MINMGLSFFDCNCMVGTRADRKASEPWTREVLLSDMEACGISDALVTHALCRDYDAAAGNHALARLISDSPNLHGCWAILPPASGEIQEPQAFLEQMSAARVVAAIAYPVTHRYSLSEWSMEPLLSALEHARVPLLLPFGQQTWDEVERLCNRYASLPVIITGLNYRQLRFLLPLWQKCRNLFVDLSWFSIHDGLAYLADHGLLGQVLFGTNYPLYEPGAAITMVTYANISDEERRTVAGGTLRDIINGIRTERR
jgi:predicted TIM-barrel fold metal-dependent hydrolase